MKRIYEKNEWKEYMKRKYEKNIWKEYMKRIYEKNKWKEYMKRIYEKNIWITLRPIMSLRPSSLSSVATRFSTCSATSVADKRGLSMTAFFFVIEKN